MDMDAMLEKALAVKNGRVGEIDSLIRLLRSAELESFGMGDGPIEQALDVLFPENNAPAQKVLASNSSLPDKKVD